MAEEKKFLDETMEQPKNRKLVAKNVVLAFVVFVILLLCVLAWFSAKNDANASGLSVKTTGASGLEVSLDGGHTWSTKWSSKKVTGEKGWEVSSALAKYDSKDSENGGSLMQLLSGNGRDLFYPKNVDANGEAKNFEKISDDKAGDYCLEFEAYFRSENPCSVGLTGESKVEPYDLSETTRNNSFGFSPDYIAGATRVAFLEEDMNNPKTLIKTGLWIPNPLYELTSEAGTVVKYRKMPDNFGGTAVTAPGGEPTDTNRSSDFYLWTSSVALLEGNTNQKEVVKHMNDRKYPLISLGNGKYYCQFYTVAPSGQVEQVFTISTSADDWTTDFVKKIPNVEDYYDPFIYLKQYGESSEQYKFVDASKEINWGLISNDYGLNSYDDKNYRFTRFNYEGTTADSSQLIRVEFDTVNKTITLMDPDKSQVTINRPNGSLLLKKGEKIVVSREFSESSDTVIKGMCHKLTETVDSLSTATFNPDYDNSECDLVVANDAEENPNKEPKYKLQFRNTGKYLAVDGDNLITVDSIDDASYFYVVFSSKKTKDENNKNIFEKFLAYVSTDSNGNRRIKYLTLSSSDGSFALSSTYKDEEGNVETGYMIYQQVEKDFTKYGIRTDKTVPIGVQESNYYYFNGETKAKEALQPEEYMTSLDDEKNKDLVKLETTKEINGKTYYVGKMKVRIFAEGFDREAKKPMEKGKIKVSLQFAASYIS